MTNSIIMPEGEDFWTQFKAKLGELLGYDGDEDGVVIGLMTSIMTCAISTHETSGGTVVFRRRDLRALIKMNRREWSEKQDRCFNEAFRRIGQLCEELLQPSVQTS